MQHTAQHHVWQHLRHRACNTEHATCNIRHVTCNKSMQHRACNMHMQQKNATQSMQHATQSLHTQDATQSMQHTACNRRNIRHVICTCDSEHVTFTCRHAKRDLRDARCSAPVTFCDFIPYLTKVGTCSSTARRVSRSITVTPANQAGQCTHAHTRTRAHAYPRPDGDRAPLSTTLCVRSPSTRPIGPIASTSSCLHCAVLVADDRQAYWHYAPIYSATIGYL